MVDEFNKTNIKNGNYIFDASKYFFTSDAIRIIIIIYIIISFLANLLYFISFLRTKSKSDKHKGSIILLLNILLINFVHTFSYFYEWVLQDVDDKDSLYVNDDGQSCSKEDFDCNGIGGLLIGNMEDSNTCKAQAFFLVFTALSQDILINVFFYIINKQSEVTKFYIYIRMLFLGYAIPLLISIIYAAIDGLGLNDKYCFIKKFIFDNEVEEHYKSYSGYKALISIFYCFRLINFIISCLLLYKIVGFVRKYKLDRKYIFKSCMFLIVQIFTIFVGLMYRFGGFFSNKFSRDFSPIFLVINTLDGVVFPVFTYFSNSMYKSLCSNADNNLDILLNTQDNDITANNLTLTNQAKNAENADKSTKENKNNFSLSYI